MNTRPALLLLLLVLLLAAACSLPVQVSLAPAATASPAAAVTPEAPSAAPAATAATAAGDPRQVVREFLTALKDNPPTADLNRWLAPGVQKELAGGKTALEMLGAQSAVPSFELSAVTLSPDGTGASVEATLNYPTPLNRRFILVQVDETWKIGSILLLEGSRAYPSTPEGVVQAFVTAYQETPDQMSHYLSAGRKANLPPGGAVGMLQVSGALEGMVVQSAAVNPEPPGAAVTVTLRAGGVESGRVFTLVKDGDTWQIENIDPVR